MVARYTQLALCQVVAQGVGGGVGAVARGDLAVQVLQVPLDGALAHRERGGGLAVALPGGDEAQHRRLALRQAVGVARRRAHERAHRGEAPGAGEGRRGAELLAGGAGLGERLLDRRHIPGTPVQFAQRQ